MSFVQSATKRCSRLLDLARSQNAGQLRPISSCYSTERRSYCSAPPGAKLMEVKDMPGPRSFPIIGTQWIFKPYGKLDRDDIQTSVPDVMYKRYGPIYREKYRGSWIVHVFDARDIYEIFDIRDPMPYRPGNKVGVYYRKKNPEKYNSASIADSQGEEWRNLRSKFNVEMMSPNYARPYFEYGVEPSDQFIQTIKKARDPFTGLLMEFGSYVDRYAMENIWSTFTEELCGIMAPGSSSEMEIVLSNSVDFFRSFKFLMTVQSTLFMNISPKCRRSMKLEEQNRRIIEQKYKRIKETLSRKKSGTEGLIRRLLQSGRVQDKDMIMILTDTIVSGTITTSTFVSMLLHRLVKEPRVLRKLRNEIDAIYPDSNGPIDWELITKMRYLKATVKEGNRCASIIPNLVKFIPTEIELKGYRIPALTPIVLEIRHANVQNNYFRNPHQFIPERWLRKEDIDPDYADYVPEAHEHARLVTPFGIGPRQCLGRRIAENSIHLLLVKILKAFDLKNHKEKLDLHNAFVLAPKGPVGFYLNDRE